VELAWKIHKVDIQDVMPARAQQGILGTDHGQEGAMDMVLRPLIVVIQVVVVADFSQVEEVQGSLVVAWEVAEKEAEDFYREEWAEEPCITMLMEDLVVVVALMDGEEVLAAVEDILVEAVEIMKTTPVGEGEDLITPEKISKMNAVTKQLAMVM